MRKVIASVLLIVSIVFLYKGFVEFRYMISNKANYQSLREVATGDIGSNPMDRVIDFEKLQSINEDIKAWIYIPGTKVDYPILVGETDEEYLYKDMNRAYTPLGSLFSFSGTNFTKGNTFIFGHNMASSQMFGELRKYIDKDFLKEHRYLYVYTERKAMKCDIFSIFVTNENDEIFNGEYELGTVEYVSLLEELNKKNKYSEYSLEESSINYSTKQIFNLTTCYGAEGTTERLVVNGIVAEEKIR
ncbi:TPA: class B sortase [Clostridioides difficile]|nr:class B sortase [Clostridioides difficile]